MRKPTTVKSLEGLGRVRLSENFFLRDFLHSEIAQIYGIPNIPDDPDLAIAAGRALCETLLEPIVARFGRISIRSAFRAVEMNRIGNERGHNCGANEANFGGHIWDRRDAGGEMGATACIVVHAFLPHYELTGDWEALAWWVHDHLPYSEMEFFPKLCAFNLGWRETPRRRIRSYIPPRMGVLTKPDMANNQDRHEDACTTFLSTL